MEINNIRIENLEEVLRIFRPENVSLDVRSSIDIQKLNKLNLDEPLTINVDIRDLPNLKELVNNKKFKIILEVKDITELDEEKLSKLERLIPIQKVRIKQEKVQKKENRLFQAAEEEFINREIYTKDVYKILLKEINKIIKDVHGRDEERFLKIYTTLGKKISYDEIHDDVCKFLNLRGAIALPEDHSMVGGLFEGETVCEGYSKILQQCLIASGMEASCVIGRKRNDNSCLHAWNQVKCSGKWYNCDLTWDSQNIQDGWEDLKYCLKGDRDFYLNHQTDRTVVHRCTKNFSQSYIRNFMINENSRNKNKLYKPSLIDRIRRNWYNRNRRKEKVVTNKNISQAKEQRVWHSWTLKDGETEEKIVFSNKLKENRDNSHTREDDR